MAGYYDNNISEIILERVNIIDLISGYVSLKRTGRNYKGLCPFHSEKSPSFIVSEDKQLYHCFGCGAAGNAIGFFMQIENLDFLDAIEMLAEKYSIDISRYRSDKSSTKVVDNKKELYQLTRDAAVYFYKNLKTSDIAKSYLTKRNLSDDIIKEFGLGYATDSWDGLIKNFNGKNTKLLEEAGLVLKRRDKEGYYDRFRNRLIFPIINVQGKVIGFGGRVLDNSLPKYLNSPETSIFNKSMTLYGLNIAKNHIQGNKQIIVVEGYMDVISLHMHGVRNVVATLGTALTKQHGNLLSRYADEIIICYDGDEAGQNAAFRSIEVLSDIKAKIKILTLEDGLDPDDYIKKFGKDQFEKQVQSSKPSIEYKLSVFKSKYNIKNDDEKIDYITECLGYLSTLKSEVQKEIYLEFLSEETKVDLSILQKELVKVSKNQKPQSIQRVDDEERVYDYRPSSELKGVVKSKTGGVASKYVKLELRILEFALMNKKYFEKIISSFDLEGIRNDKIKTVFMELIKYYAYNNEFRYENAAEYFEIDLLKSIKKVLDDMVPISDGDKEIEKAIKDHTEMSASDELNEVISRLGHLNVQKSKLSPDKDSEILSEIHQEIEILKDRMAVLNKKRASFKNK